MAQAECGFSARDTAYLAMAPGWGSEDVSSRDSVSVDVTLPPSCGKPSGGTKSKTSVGRTRVSAPHTCPVRGLRGLWRMMGVSSGEEGWRPAFDLAEPATLSFPTSSGEGWWLRLDPFRPSGR